MSDKNNKSKEHCWTQAKPTGFAGLLSVCVNNKL